MSIEYLPLAAIADEAADRIRAALPGVKVEVAAATNAAQLFELAAIAIAPQIIVCIGEVRYLDTEDDLAREIGIIAAVSAAYRKKLSDKAKNIWELGEDIAKLFCFASDDLADDDPLSWRVGSITPGAGSADLALLYVNINCKEFAQDGNQV